MQLTRINKWKLTFLVSLIYFLTLNYTLAQNRDIIITEVNYESDSTKDSGDWVEIYNVSNKDVDLSGWVFTDIALNQFFNFPAGIVIKSKSYIVLCQNLDLFKEQYPDVENCIGSFGWGIKHKKEILNLFDKENNLHFSFNYVDSLPWPKCANGHGRTMELRDIEGDFNDGTNWFSGCMGGSPGKAYSHCDEQLIISEINYNSSETIPVGDWFELRNISNKSMDISNWKVGDKNDSIYFNVPSGTIIKPGENIVFSKKLDDFKLEYPWVNKVIGPFTFSLGSDGEVIKLFNQNGLVYYSVYFNSVEPWPIQALGSGRTIEIVDSSKNASEANNWIAGCIGGSPGTYYNSNCILSLKDLPKKHEKNNLYPNPVQNFANILLCDKRLIEANKFSVIVYDEMGHSVKFQEIEKQLLDEQNIFVRLDISGLKTGMYLYVVECNNKRVTQGNFIKN